MAKISLCFCRHHSTVVVFSPIHSIVVVFFYIFILYSSFFCLFLDVQCRQCRQCMYIFGDIVKRKKNIILRLFIFAWIFFIHHFSNVWFSLSASVNIVFFFFFSLMSFFCTCHSSFGNLLLRFFSVHTYLYANTIAFLRWISKKKKCQPPIEWVKVVHQIDGLFFPFILTVNDNRLTCHWRFVSTNDTQNHIFDTHIEINVFTIQKWQTINLPYNIYAFVK